MPIRKNNFIFNFDRTQLCNTPVGFFYIKKYFHCFILYRRGLTLHFSINNCNKYNFLVLFCPIFMHNFSIVWIVSFCVKILICVYPKQNINTRKYILSSNLNKKGLILVNLFF
ncbi:hypothetical protein EDEG_00264 [Edhazardia aedis USNM 41457]|uniref:Uncharacterized protein n=1 Tax=Edhazardia aedis (strain USNM 41457) TaxID=1003232 RepID=J9DJ39_EDHAE|nr:hypothetical protein EDEG_00264 [Edhazardia aedis USNM 41457]|eukprot:EJW02610.1 hypothetical protein EDEG_00264 [Edhazardia aedis USNM 41457]